MIKHMFKRQPELKGKLTRYFFFQVFALLLVMLPVFIYLSFIAQRNALREAQQATAEKVALTVPEFIERFVQDLSREANRQDLMQLTQTERAAALKTMLDNFSQVSDLSVLDAAGKKVAEVSRYWVTPTAYASNQTRALTGQQAALQGQPYLGQVYIAVEANSAQNEPFMVVAVPLQNERGEVTSILSANLNLSFMWEIVAQSRVGEQGYLYVVDNAGELIAHPDPYLTLIQLDLEQFPDVHAVLGGPKELVQKEYQGLADQAMLGSFIPIQSSGWWVVVELPLSEVYGSIGRMLLVSGLLFFVVFLVTLFSSRYLSTQLTSPLEKLRGGAEIVGQGNLTHVIDVQTNDEIGILAQAFNSMAGQLRKAFTTLQSQRGKISLAIRGL